MNTNIVLKSPDLAEDFAREAVALGYKLAPVPGLSRHFILLDTTPDEFPLKAHSSIETIQPESKLYQEATQDVVLPAQLDSGGGWAAARTIRRASPWAPPRSWIMESNFNCKRTGAGVDLFMVDSGCDDFHPEFQGRAGTSWYATPSYASTLDDSGHGSHCMAMAGGSTVGIAREARLLTMKFFNANSGATSANALPALGAILIQYQMTAADDRPAVMFFSWSGFDSAVNAAVSDMINAGIVCCFPAGNNSIDLGTVNQYPAESDPDAIICGGIQMSDEPYFTPSYGSGTNYGVEVDILAPAQGTTSVNRTSEGGGYRRGSGTSYSTPVVAGVIACMLQGYKRLTTRAEVQAVKQRLLDNATAGVKPLRKPVDDGSAEGGSSEPITLPDRIAYLDPNIEFEVIQRLTPRLP